jgi:hypothetical protein
MIALVLWVVIDPRNVALLALPSDDAFYYFTIARNVVAGNGLTFDGITTTNGWHPLWMLFLLPIFCFFPDDLETPIRAALGLNAILAVATVAWLHRIVNRRVAPGFGLLAVGLAILPHCATAMTNGLETGLLLFALIALLSFCYRLDADTSTVSPAVSLGFGVFIGMVTLCRLDAAFLLPASLILLGAAALRRRTHWRRTVVRAIVEILGFAIPFGVFAAWNVSRFGEIMPISGAVKSTMPHLRESLTLRGDMWMGLVLAVGIWLTLLLSSVCTSRSAPSRRRGPLLLLALSCTLHYVHAFLFLDWGVYWWHFAPYGLCLAMTLPAAAESVLHRISVRPRPIVVGAFVLCGIGSAILIVRQLDIKYRQHAAWCDAAQWANENTPADAVFALKDAGLFGYFSRRSVVNLDGKANGREYLPHLRDGTVEDYLRTVNVRYMADVHARYRQGQYAIAIPRVNRHALILMMHESDEVYRSDTIPAHASRFGSSADAHFAIWTYPPHTLTGNQ